MSAPWTWAGRDVAVGVHDVADRDARPDDLAHAADELGVGVGVALGDHRAVLGDQHAVERPFGLQPLELVAGDPLESRGRPRPDGMRCWRSRSGRRRRPAANRRRGSRRP